MIINGGREARNQAGPMAQTVILHVEDTPEQRQLVQALLGTHAAVYPADSLGAARQLLDRLESLTLVLLDNQLPDGSGLDLVGDIRARHPGCRIVLHSAEVAASPPAGVDGVISKADTPLGMLRDAILGYLE